jgi:predicted Zn finger-like uncharacterized protein
MKIECPNCKLTGQVSDANIPPEGRGMECPRCKTDFFIQKSPTANWADTVTDCPQCGYSTFSAERFDICPKCGLVVKDYKEKRGKQPGSGKGDIPAAEPVKVDRERMRQDLERLEREEQRKRQQRLESAGIPLPPPETVPDAVEAPAAVKYLGWAFILLSLVVLAYGGKGVYDYVKITPAQAVTSPYEDPPSSFRLYLTHGLSPIVMVSLGFYFMVAGSQFLTMRPWARKGVEAASWLGIIFIVVRELVSLFVSVSRASGDATIGYYLVELAGFILMATFWSSPLLAAIWCLRKDFIKDAFGE